MTGLPPLADAAALDQIAEWLSDPAWAVGMLEDIEQVVAATGRNTADRPRPDCLAEHGSYADQWTCDCEPQATWPRH